MTSALDASLIYTTLKSAVKVGEILSVDADRRLIWNNILNKLSPVRLDANGLLCEHLEENDASDSKSFRYLSLYSLVTSDILFSENRNNELDAALRTIDYYTAHDMSMSPVNAVRTALIYARTGCCDKAAALLGAVSQNSFCQETTCLSVTTSAHRFEYTVRHGGFECLVSYSNGRCICFAAARGMVKAGLALRNRRRAGIRSTSSGKRRGGFSRYNNRLHRRNSIKQV